MKIQPTEIRDYCQDEVFKAECTGEDEVVLMTSAVYGRMRSGRCTPYEEFLNCSADVLEQIDSMYVSRFQRLFSI